MSRGADLAEISQVLARYGDGVNRRDAELWGSTWDVEAEWVLFDPDNPVTGRDAIVAAWNAAMQDFPEVTMYVTQGAVEIDGDRATGRSYSFEIARPKDGKLTRVRGTYADEYRRRDGEWRFSSRRFTVIGAEELE